MNLKELKTEWNRIEAGKISRETLTKHWADWIDYWAVDFDFKSKKDRSLELTSTAHECTPGSCKIAVKVVDIFGNNTMKILEVNV